jgi:hypothetical protein
MGERKKVIKLSKTAATAELLLLGKKATIIKASPNRVQE